MYGRLFSPLVIVPVVSLVGLGLFARGFPQVFIFSFSSLEVLVATSRCGSHDVFPSPLFLNFLYFSFER